MKNKKIKIIISWILVVIWMITIFTFSNMNTYESNSKSKSLITNMITTTIETTNKIGITDKTLTNENKEKLTEKLNLPFRKFVHLTIYLILALLLINAFLVSNVKLPLTFILSILFCFIYALTDEYHQTFITGRTGKFSDVLIDTLGSIIGIFIYSFYYFLYLKIIKKQKMDKLLLENNLN